MSNLTGTDKSVILLMTIGEDRAAEVFKHLSQREVQTLSAAMANVTQISNKQLTDVLAEFEQEAEQFAALNINANDYLRSVLVKALGEERAASLLEDILETRDTASGIETLNFMEPQSAADLIRDEHPQIIATILVIAADERYLPTDNGKLFSTGNHPIETLLPLYHLHAAGFEFEVATISGLMTKFEYWAMPHKDEKVMPFFEQHKSLFRNPKKLADVVASLNADSEYAAIFVPGGHGALIGLPESQDVAAALQWAIKNDRFVISLCHGPAAFLALRHSDNPLNGYSICAFPDAADKQTPDIGYMPGHLTWYFGEELKKMGMNIINDDITGRVHKDRKLLTGDSPFAANALGKLAAQEMLAAYAS